jgi:predicted O-methyltransferase YrrM
VADEKNDDKFTNIIKDFNKYVKNDKQTEQIIIPLGDGLTVCRKL